MNSKGFLNITEKEQRSPNVYNSTGVKIFLEIIT